MTDTGLNRLCCSPASGFNTEILLCADFCLLYFNSIQLSSFIFLFLLILLLQAILQAECQQALTDVNIWLANNSSFPKNITLAELKVLQDSLKGHGKLLTTSRQIMTKLQNALLVGELEEKIALLKELNRSLELHRKKIEDNASSIWETELSPQSADELHSRSLDLEHLYSGFSRDEDDFRNMRSATEFYLDSLHKLQFLGISTADFKAQIKITRENFLTRFAEYELPWDLEKAFVLLQGTCEAFRPNAATDWLNEIQSRLENLSAMTIAQGNELRSDLDAPPQYVDLEVNAELLTSLRQQIEHFLDSKEIEWLLERFKKMSAPAQAEFLKVLHNEL